MRFIHTRLLFRQIQRREVCSVQPPRHVFPLRKPPEAPGYTKVCSTPLSFEALGSIWLEIGGAHPLPSMLLLALNDGVLTVF
jgi:hypothetical protein